MARVIEYDLDDVLRKATQLFWRKGYQQTSVSDLMDATGFNRRALYDEFGGKEGLFIAALDYYRRNYGADLIKSLNAKDADLTTLRGLFDIRLHADLRLGCLMMNTVSEKFCVQHRLFEAAKRHNARIEKGVCNCIENAKRSGDVPTNKDASFLARYVMTVLYGIGPIGKAGLTKGEFSDIATATIEFLKS